VDVITAARTRKEESTNEEEMRAAAEPFDQKVDQGVPIVEPLQKSIT